MLWFKFLSGQTNLIFIFLGLRFITIIWNKGKQRKKGFKIFKPDKILTNIYIDHLYFEWKRFTAFLNLKFCFESIYSIENLF